MALRGGRQENTDKAQQPSHGRVSVLRTVVSSTFKKACHSSLVSLTGDCGQDSNGLIEAKMTLVWGHSIGPKPHQQGAHVCLGPEGPPGTLPSSPHHRPGGARGLPGPEQALPAILRVCGSVPCRPGSESFDSHAGCSKSDLGQITQMLQAHTYKAIEGRTHAPIPDTFLCRPHPSPRGPAARTPGSLPNMSFDYTGGGDKSSSPSWIAHQLQLLNP